MLVSFSVANHLSFKEKQCLELKAGTYSEHRNNLIQLEEGQHRFLSTVAIYGANGAGKSNLIKSLGLLRFLVLFSDQPELLPKGIPHSPFRLDRKCLSLPGEFEIEFLIEKSIFRYQVQFTQHQILHEGLYYRPRKREVLLFERSSKDPGNSDYHTSQTYFKFGDSFKGAKKPALEGLTGRTLLLSRLARHKHPLALAVLNWFFYRLHVQEKFQEFEAMNRAILKNATIKRLIESDSLRQKVTGFMNSVGIPIHDIAFQEKRDLRDAFKSPELEIILPFLEAFATKAGLTLKEYDVVFQRKAVDSKGQKTIVDFFLEEESEGTRKMFSHIVPILMLLERGGAYFVDELNENLHPKLTEFIIKLFHNPDINVGGGQLLFTTHDLRLLDQSFFRRDQIWFVERPETNGSHAFSLLTKKVRNDLDIRKAYLKGKFGAIPTFDEEKIMKVYREEIRLRKEKAPGSFGLN